MYRTIRSSEGDPNVASWLQGDIQSPENDVCSYPKSGHSVPWLNTCLARRLARLLYVCLCNQPAQFPAYRSNLFPLTHSFRRPPPMRPIRPSAPLQALYRARPSARAAMHSTAAVCHARPLAGRPGARLGATARSRVCHVERFPPSGRTESAVTFHHGPRLCAPCPKALRCRPRRPVHHRKPGRAAL